MEIILLIVVALLLWGILKALNRNTRIETEKTIIKHAETVAKSAAESLVSALKPIADKFEQAKAEGRVLEWADRYLTTMANVLKQDYWEMQDGLRKHGLGPDPEYQRAIDEEEKRRNLPCKYMVFEEEWKRAWNEAPEYPSLDTLHESSMCGACEATSGSNDMDLYGADLVQLDLTPYRECPFCGEPNDIQCSSKTVPAIMADYEKDAARWKDFAERHPDRATKLEDQAKKVYRRELLAQAQDLDVAIKAHKDGMARLWPLYASSRPSTLEPAHYRSLFSARGLDESRIKSRIESLDELCLDEPGELSNDGKKFRAICTLVKDHTGQHQDTTEKVWWQSREQQG